MKVSLCLMKAVVIATAKISDSPDFPLCLNEREKVGHHLSCDGHQNPTVCCRILSSNILSDQDPK